MATKDEKKARESITVVIDKRLAWVGAILVIGFAGWSLVRFGMSLGAKPQHTHAGCKFELQPGDHYLLAGRACPGPDCKTELLKCHGGPAHRVKEMVKEMLAEGKHPNEIRGSLDQVAPRLVPEPVAAPGGLESTATGDGNEPQKTTGDTQPPALTNGVESQSPPEDVRSSTPSGAVETQDSTKDPQSPATTDAVGTLSTSDNLVPHAKDQELDEAGSSWSEK